MNPNIGEEGTYQNKPNQNTGNETIYIQVSNSEFSNEFSEFSNDASLIFSLNERVKKIEKNVDTLMQIMPDVLGKMTKELSIIKSGIHLMTKHTTFKTDGTQQMTIEIFKWKEVR